MLHDIRFALRHLRRSPGFAAAAVITLALGLGANTALLSILNALLVRPLPIPAPEQLVGITARTERGLPRYTPITAVEPLAADGPLTAVCGYNGGFIVAVDAGPGEAPTQALVAMLTGRCFETFGVAPALGRVIEEADAPILRRGAPVAVIGHRLWLRLFGGDPAAVGRTIRAEGAELTVIGVMPPGFGGLQADAGAELFVPFDTVFPARPDRRPLASEILGRLPPGKSFDAAASEIRARWPAVLEAAVPVSLPAAERNALRDVTPVVARMGSGVSAYRERYGQPLTIVLSLTALLLLLAAVNLGGLLLARVAGRREEIGVRLALGGSPWRVARTLIVESLLLAIAGAVLAVPLASAMLGPLTAIIPSALVERTVRFTLDGPVLATTLLAGVAAALVMSAVPAWLVIRRPARAHLTWQRTVAGVRGPWFRALLVAQVAMSVALVSCALLLWRSLDRLQHADLGVTTEGVITARLMPVPNGYRGLDAGSYYPALLDRIASLPGVRAAGFARLFPHALQDVAPQAVRFDGEAGDGVLAGFEGVSPGFFRAVGIPLLAGRSFDWQDNADGVPVVVISESLARQLAPDGEVLGRRVDIGTLRLHQDVLVVGIVQDATRGNPRVVDAPVVYRPALQMGPVPLYPNLVVATDRTVADLAPGLRGILAGPGREYVADVEPLAAVFAEAPSSERLSALLAAVCGVIGVVLAAIGVHGALAYMVSRRTRAIGVRLAMGAEPRALTRAVLREGVVLTLLGLVIGLPLAGAMAAALRSLLFGVTTTDPWTFTGTAIMFLALGFIAAVVPARRAARVDPAEALKGE
ncbi:MAG: ADOP family duplicated permease [Vicinamibacterales bacterium]